MKIDKLIKLKFKHSKAIINLNNGGCLQELFLQEKLIIKDISSDVPYGKSYASAVLFPFCNRLLKGGYKFSNESYQLPINSKENNAIHGLVYNKNFEVVEEEMTNNFHSISLQYREKEKQEGYPFLYIIKLIYTLSKDSLTLKVVVDNIDEVEFPFNIGWHPYFFSENIKESELYINSSKEIINNNKMIPVKIADSFLPKVFKIGNKHMDHCYQLEGDELYFVTSNYKLKIHSSLINKYIQIFTPSIKNSIAIEPMMAPANSFNNKIGLEILKPKNTFDITWKLSLEN